MGIFPKFSRFFLVMAPLTISQVILKMNARPLYISQFFILTLTLSLSLRTILIHFMADFSYALSDISRHHPYTFRQLPDPYQTPSAPYIIDTPKIPTRHPSPTHQIITKYHTCLALPSGRSYMRVVRCCR